MRGFHRLGQPLAFGNEQVRDVVTRFVADEIAQLTRTADPFAIDHDCVNAGGHHFIASCGDIVCIHCGRIAWA